MISGLISASAISLARGKTRDRDDRARQRLQVAARQAAPAGEEAQPLHLGDHRLRFRLVDRAPGAA